MSLVESLYDASSACLDFYFFSPCSYEWGKKNMLLFSALGWKVKQIIVLGSAAMILVGRRRE